MFLHHIPLCLYRLIQQKQTITTFKQQVGKIITRLLLLLTIFKNQHQVLIISTVKTQTILKMSKTEAIVDLQGIIHHPGLDTLHILREAMKRANMKEIDRGILGLVVLVVVAAVEALLDTGTESIIVERSMMRDMNMNKGDVNMKNVEVLRIIEIIEVTVAAMIAMKKDGAIEAQIDIDTPPITERLIRKVVQGNCHRDLETLQSQDL